MKRKSYDSEVMSFFKTEAINRYGVTGIPYEKALAHFTYKVEPRVRYRLLRSDCSADLRKWIDPFSDHKNLSLVVVLKSPETSTYSVVAINREGSIASSDNTLPKGAVLFPRSIETNNEAKPRLLHIGDTIKNSGSFHIQSGSKRFSDYIALHLHHFGEQHKLPFAGYTITDIAIALNEPTIAVQGLSQQLNEGKIMEILDPQALYSERYYIE